MAFTSTLQNGERAERKLIITVAEWTEGNTQKREILGTRTEDSSIEFNPDVETSTDIRGNTYTEIKKTEPKQTFDAFYLLGGSSLGDYLSKAALKNDINSYNSKFNVYIIQAYMKDGTSYYAVKHSNCSIIPQSLGGDAFANMPIEVGLSNNITEGAVDKLSDDFVFTPAASV